MTWWLRIWSQHDLDLDIWMLVCVYQHVLNETQVYKEWGRNQPTWVYKPISNRARIFNAFRHGTPHVHSCSKQIYQWDDISQTKPLGLSNSPTAIMTVDVPKMWLAHQLFRVASDEAGDSLADSAGEGSCASSHELFHAVSKTTFTTLTSFFLWITMQIYTYRWFTCGLHPKNMQGFPFSHPTYVRMAMAATQLPHLSCTRPQRLPSGEVGSPFHKMVERVHLRSTKCT
jgi:hypothetical protein